MEHQAQAMQEQKEVIDNLYSKELSTKSDIYALELKIELYKYESLKFIVWTGMGVVITLGGVMAKGFHWF